MTTQKIKSCRLDQAVFRLGLVASRSQAESYIRLGKVSVNGRTISKPGYFVDSSDKIILNVDEQFVSRAGLKLKSVADILQINFADKIVLDVGSSTGGFTDFALSRGCKKVICVDVGTDQLHPKLRQNAKVELHEKTDIRNFYYSDQIDIIVIDVSFISLREILPHIARYLAGNNTKIIAMVKPQFEIGASHKKSGVVKNDAERRRVLRDFEIWSRNYFVINDKADSAVAGARGNRERFYSLTIKKVINNG